MLIEWWIELKESIDRHGIRWGVALTLYAIYRKERRNRRLDKRDELHNASFTVILKNQEIMMNHMGVQPCADTSNLLTRLSVKIVEDGYTFSWVEKLAAQYAARKGIQSFTLWNMEGKQMLQALTSSISKKLAAFIIAAGVTVCNNKFGLELNADTIYGLYAIAIAYIIGQSHVDAKKAISNAVNAVTSSIVEAATTTDGTPITTITAPPLSYQETVPYLKAISGDLQQIFDQLNSGKHTDETQRALNIALTVHDYLKKSKGA